MSKIKKASDKKPLEVKNNRLNDDRSIVSQSILNFTESKLTEKYSDQNLDKQNEIIRLRSGIETTRKEIEELRKYVSGLIRVHSKEFIDDWYREINRLNSWNKPEQKIYQKPPIVAVWTNEIIYGRFPREILPTIQNVNRMTELGIRPHRHFQYLTEDGLNKLRKYINESLELMRACSTWSEFRFKYSKAYGLPFQLSLFKILI